MYSLYTHDPASRIRVSESLGPEHKPKCKLVNGVINTQTNKHLQWSEVKSPPLSVTLCMRESDMNAAAAIAIEADCDVFSLCQGHIYRNEVLCIVTNHTVVWPQTNFPNSWANILFFFKFSCWKKGLVIEADYTVKIGILITRTDIAELSLLSLSNATTIIKEIRVVPVS